jgi:hypothetical protein
VIEPEESRIGEITVSSVKRVPSLRLLMRSPTQGKPFVIEAHIAS